MLLSIPVAATSYHEAIGVEGSRMPKRQPIVPTNEWQQLELRFTNPTQRTYELIRPVVLFGQSPRERAQETDTN
jgi:hypothetical protein